MDEIEVRKALNNSGFFQPWMSRGQRAVLAQALRGEEGKHFVNVLTELKARIEAMPKTYETDGVDGDEKVAYLHYFMGGVDAWIVEKDRGDGSADETQYQAFGKITLFGGGGREAEWGYINIEELIANGVELDLYWTPKPMKEVR